MWAAAILPAVLAFSLAVGARAWLLRRRIGALTIDNYRGLEVSVVGGVVIAFAVAGAELIVWSIGMLSQSLRAPLATPAGAGTLALALGFFALGFLDDYAGDRRSKGFAGHLRALRSGEVTTGAIKAFGGMGLAFAVSLWWERWSVPAALVDALVIALAANLINLLDLRPGRAAKGFFLLAVPVAVAASGTAFLPVAAAVAAAVVAWLPADLAEKGTLGDAGANMLGAVVGAGVVAGADLPLRIAALAVLAALTLASERVSFTGVIERTGPLRWLDGLGRSGPG